MGSRVMVGMPWPWIAFAILLHGRFDGALNPLGPDARGECPVCGLSCHPSRDQDGLDGRERCGLAAGLRLVQQEFDEPSFVLGLARHPDETPGDLDPPPADRDPEDRDAKSNGRVHDPAHEFHSLLSVHRRAEPVKDVVSRQAPRSRCLGDELASNPECISGRCGVRGWVSQGRDLQDSRYLAVNRVGDLPRSRHRFHRADLHVRDVHEGQAVGLEDRGHSAQRMEATARQNLQLAADLGEQVHQHAAVRAAADPLSDLVSDLVDETLGPMSHLGSIRGCGEPSRRSASPIPARPRR